jgi:hypothetical protein
MEPIETEYKGYRFRSRLEARWAVIFDWMDVSWRYEPQGFELPKSGRYLPDFLLPDFEAILSQTTPKRASGLWIEVKGGDPARDERAKSRELAWESDRPVAILCSVGEDDPSFLYPHHGRQPMESTTVNILSYITAHNFRQTVFSACLEAEDALSQARSARFEHGEKGAGRV